MLVGVGGSGKQSLARFAAFIAETQVGAEGGLGDDMARGVTRAGPFGDLFRLARGRQLQDSTDRCVLHPCRMEHEALLAKIVGAPLAPGVHAGAGPGLRHGGIPGGPQEAVQVGAAWQRPHHHASCTCSSSCSCSTRQLASAGLSNTCTVTLRFAFLPPS